MKNKYNINVDYNDYIEAQLIIDNIPELFDGNGKTALYVGANFMRAYFLDFLWECGYVVDIIEIFQGNEKPIREKYKFRNLIIGDISEKQNIKENYDLIFWYHGPEHVSEAIFEKTSLLLDGKAKMIVLGCPYDDTIQDEVYGNIFEKHLWGITQGKLNALGYTTAQCNRKNASDNIIGWKKP
jgi:hypothetical protein